MNIQTELKTVENTINDVREEVLQEYLKELKITPKEHWTSLLYTEIDRRISKDPYSKGAILRHIRTQTCERLLALLFTDDKTHLENLLK